MMVGLIRDRRKLNRRPTRKIPPEILKKRLKIRYTFLFMILTKVVLSNYLIK